MPPWNGGFVRDNLGMNEAESDRPAYTRVTRSHKGVDADARRKERRQRLVEAGLAMIPPAGRSAAHLEAARFFFANGYAPEALGFLRMAASEEPSLAENGAFRALRGACQALMGRWDLAISEIAYEKK